MKILRWLWHHWYIPVLAVVGVVGFFLGAKFTRKSPLELVDREMQIIGAGERARKLRAVKGKDEANAVADIEYRRDLNALDARQKRKAERLRRNPAARARFLARVSSKRGTDPI